jgi:hypothetical protein
VSIWSKSWDEPAGSRGWTSSWISFLLVIDLVTTQAGYKSDAISDVNFSQTIGSRTTLPPAKSFPSNTETLWTGRVGQTPTIPGPVIKSDFYAKQYQWRLAQHSVVKLTSQ